MSLFRAFWLAPQPPLAQIRLFSSFYRPLSFTAWSDSFGDYRITTSSVSAPYWSATTHESDVKGVYDWHELVGSREILVTDRAELAESIYWKLCSLIAPIRFRRLFWDLLNPKARALLEQYIQENGMEAFDNMIAANVDQRFEIASSKTDRTAWRYPNIVWMLWIWGEAKRQYYC